MCGQGKLCFRLVENKYVKAADQADLEDHPKESWATSGELRTIPEEGGANPEEPVSVYLWQMMR